CCVGKNLITLRRNATFTALPSTKISYQFQTLIYSPSLKRIILILKLKYIKIIKEKQRELHYLGRMIFTLVAVGFQK
ncbi:MAG: hypothetical protein ACI94Y_002959, partial [Maribacter sp.]